MVFNNFLVELTPFSLVLRLSTGKQSKVYLPEEPFPHAHLIKNGRLKHFPSLHADGFTNEYRQVKIIDIFCIQMNHSSFPVGSPVSFSAVIHRCASEMWFIFLSFGVTKAITVLFLSNLTFRISKPSPHISLLP